MWWNSVERYDGTVEQYGGTVEQYSGTVEQYCGTVEQYGGTVEHCVGTLLNRMVEQWNSAAVWCSVVEQCGTAWRNSSSVAK